MTADEAIGILTGAQTMVLNRDPDKFVQAANRAILALDSERQRKDPQPITIEELRQMDGEPVWVHNLEVGKSFWALAYKDVVSNRLGWMDYYGYGKIWVAYRHKPKEG